ncbi:MAG: porin [Rickettsiales bacterium]|nr:porin [Rickettsiales bacterium]
MFSNGYAYQIASNHSYVKNSSFTTNYYVNVEGYGDFKSVFQGKKGTSKSEKLILQNEVSVNINLEAELDEITKYGIKFIQVFNNTYDKEREYYGYLHGYYGRLEFGDTLSVAENMRIGADTIALGSGGIGSSDFIRSVTMPASSFYILAPGTLSSQNFGYHSTSSDQDYWDKGKYQTKISYYSPEFLGLQIGFGVTPNVKLLSGSISSTVPTSDVSLGTMFSYGLSYINTFDSLGIVLSMVGEENVADKAVNNVDGVGEMMNDKFSSREFGVNINYFGLTFAASTGSTQRKVQTTQLISSTYGKGEYKTYGFVYELSEFSVSATYFNSEYKKHSKFNSAAFAIEDKMSKNLSLYIEYIKFKAEYIVTPTKNEGFSVLCGILLNFN